MLTTIHVQNLAVLKDVHLTELGPLTVLIGPPSSGKSTLLFALQLARAQLQGRLHSLLGPKESWGDLQSRDTTDPIHIDLTLAAGEVWSMHLDLRTGRAQTEGTDAAALHTLDALVLQECPEQGLDLRAVAALPEHLRSQGQALITTCSTWLADHLTLEEVVTMQQVAGFSHATRPSRSPSLRALVAQGDRPGDLWRQGLLDAATILPLETYLEDEDDVAEPDGSAGVDRRMTSEAIFTHLRRPVDP